MTVKELALKSIQDLPENTTWGEVQERINFLAAIEEGLRELDEGKGIPHEEIEKEFARWLSD